MYYRPGIWPIDLCGEARAKGYKITRGKKTKFHKCLSLLKFGTDKRKPGWPDLLKPSRSLCCAVSPASQQSMQDTEGGETGAKFIFFAFFKYVLLFIPLYSVFSERQQVNFSCGQRDNFFLGHPVNIYSSLKHNQTNLILFLYRGLNIQKKLTG